MHFRKKTCIEKKLFHVHPSPEGSHAGGAKLTCRIGCTYARKRASKNTPFHVHPRKKALTQVGQNWHARLDALMQENVHRKYTLPRSPPARRLSRRWV